MFKEVLILTLLTFFQGVIMNRNSPGSSKQKGIDTHPDNRKSSVILSAGAFRSTIDSFARHDTETVVNFIPNEKAWEWMAENVPYFECPDKEIEEIYYFRWWTYRKHIRQTPDGFVITEFLPKVSWSKTYNTINCAAGHHLYEGRWIHDPQFLNDYGQFYFKKGGDPGGTCKEYSNWLTDGIYARYLVNADKSFPVSLLSELVRNQEAWDQDGAPGKKWQKSRLLDNGLYWQIDSWEGTEYSIGGTGIRPPVNSYMYGNNVAIAHIAELAGDKALAEKYLRKAEKLKQLIQDSLWDAQSRFFKVRRNSQAPIDQYKNQSAEKCDPGKLVSVRELFGYVPWYFNLPDKGKGYEADWKQLTDPNGFRAEYGPSVAERRHPGFKINERGCEWCGASWPYATSQTLTALANLLNNYSQQSVTGSDYFELLKTYTRSHHRKRQDGSVVPWIDESLNPDTGEWIPTEGDPPRGKDYNHSTYCDLIITGLVGLRPRADQIIEVNPLIPVGTWDYFCLDHVLYHGQIITILYDKTGKKYGKGKGLSVYANGRMIARSRQPEHVTGRLQ